MPSAHLVTDSQQDSKFEWKAGISNAQACCGRGSATIPPARQVHTDAGDDGAARDRNRATRCIHSAYGMLTVDQILGEGQKEIPANLLV